jgi:hypothetical protein
VFARVTLLEIDTLRVGVDDALVLFEQGVMPGLRDQPGFLGVYAMTTPDGKALLMSFWETPQQAASVENPWYTGVLEEHMTIFRSPPGRQSYEVRIAEPPRGSG